MINVNESDFWEFKNEVFVQLVIKLIIWFKLLMSFETYTIGKDEDLSNQSKNTKQSDRKLKIWNLIQ